MVENIQKDSFLFYDTIFLDNETMELRKYLPANDCQINLLKICVKILGIDMDEGEGGNCINFIQDRYQGHLMCLASTGPGKAVLFRSKKNNIRYVEKFDKSKLHPHSLAAYRCGYGKQISSLYKNLYISKAEQKWIISYIDEGRAFERWKREDVDQEILKACNLNYNIFDLLNGELRTANRMIFKNDNRNIRPRVRCDFKEGLFLQIMNSQTQELLFSEQISISSNL